jgi:ectoine hydroxylase-related dioxygenase (phytanoyl-CoA dioxygenase family)
MYPSESEIGRNGLVVLPGAVEPALCDAVVAQYAVYEQRLLDGHVALRDAQNRNRRVTNFHLISKDALEIACNATVHEALDRYFGRTSMVYSSLYFKHGSQQELHIDTPFFVSDPLGWFAGAWVALEDVNPAAGPVEYVHGAHRLFDTREKLLRLCDGSTDVDHLLRRVRELANSVSRPVPALLRKGDVLIWHHALPHGGQKAIDLRLTRQSLVFHMGAEGVNLRTNGLFDAVARELPRYGIVRHKERAVARVGLPAVMM